MTNSDFLLFLKDGRHVFSICPECSEVNRLSELGLATKGRYQADWLDRLVKAEEGVQMKIESLSGKRAQLESAAREKALKSVLPKLLEKAAPSFAKRRINPSEVRTLISPTQFVVFKGLNSAEGVHEVAFLHVGPDTAETLAIGRVIDQRSLGWNTIRLGDDGRIAEVGAGSKQRRLDRFPAGTPALPQG